MWTVYYCISYRTAVPDHGITMIDYHDNIMVSWKYYAELNRKPDSHNRSQHTDQQVVENMFHKIKSRLLEPSGQIPWALDMQHIVFLMMKSMADNKPNLVFTIALEYLTWYILLL